MVCEAFHASIKKERIYLRSSPTRPEAKAAVFEYIEAWYNGRHRHSIPGYLSPAAYEQQRGEELPVALQSTPSSNGSVVGTTSTTRRRT